VHCSFSGDRDWIPLVVSLSNHEWNPARRRWFDKLSTNGWLSSDNFRNRSIAASSVASFLAKHSRARRCPGGGVS
jgi:hypothetical protein